MAKISAKGAVISVDDSGGTARNISGDCVSFDIKEDAGKVKVTGFEPVENSIPGLPIHIVTLEILWNTLATTGAMTVLRGIYGSSTSKTVSITPEVGGLTYSGEFMLDALPTKGTPAGEIKIGTVTFSVMGAVAPAWA